jgi:hypothetical protein
VDIILAGENWIDWASGIYPIKFDYRHSGFTDSQAGKKRGRQKIQISTNTGAYSQINDMPVISSDLTVFFPTL